MNNKYVSSSLFAMLVYKHGFVTAIRVRKSLESPHVAVWINKGFVDTVLLILYGLTQCPNWDNLAEEVQCYIDKVVRQHKKVSTTRKNWGVM